MIEKKIKWPIAQKLLISFLALILTVSAILTVSSALIVSQDKKAYLLQSQSSELQLLSKELSRMVISADVITQQSINILEERENAAFKKSGLFQKLIQTQNDVTRIEVSRLLPPDQKIELLYAVEKKQTPPLELDKIALNILYKNGFYIKRVGNEIEPELCFYRLFEKQDLQIVVAAALPLKSIAKAIGLSQITLFNQQNQILFDLDPEKTKKDVGTVIYDQALRLNSQLGSMEFMDRNEKFLGSYSKIEKNLILTTQLSWNEVMKSTYQMILRFFITSLFALSLSAIFAILFGSSLSRTIEQLFEATQKIAKGDFSTLVEVNNQDETGALASAFNFMSEKVNKMLVLESEKQKLENELAVASAVQNNLIPESSFSGKGITVEGYYQSASQCGGDWWGKFDLDGKTYIAIADATGHGVSSALITAAVHSAFSLVEQVLSENPSLDRSVTYIMQLLNTSIFKASKGTIMMTVFLAVIDPKTNTLTWARAGHNPPVLLRNTGGKVQKIALISGGKRLGEEEKLLDIEEKSMLMLVGDLIVFYTDGLTEGLNAEGEQYGKKRFYAVATDLAEKKSTPKEVIISICKEFKGFTLDHPLNDDITLVALTYQGEGNVAA